MVQIKFMPLLHRIGLRKPLCFRQLCWFLMHYQHGIRLIELIHYVLFNNSDISYSKFINDIFFQQSARHSIRWELVLCFCRIQSSSINHGFLLVAFAFDFYRLCFVCLFGVFRFSSYSKIFHSYGDVIIGVEGPQNLTYVRHSWPLSCEGSLACHAYCDTGHLFIMDISEDPWHSHLLPSVWQWSCHYLFLRLRSVAAGIWTLNLPLAGRTLYPTAPPPRLSLISVSSKPSYSDPLILTLLLMFKPVYCWRDKIEYRSVVLGRLYNSDWLKHKSTVYKTSIMQSV